MKGGRVVKRKSETSGDISGFLDRDVQLKGEISFKETLRIDGKFEGIIRSSKNLVVGESADVNAEVEVETLSVSGRLRGSAKASERIELFSTARVQSNLATKILVIQEGAVFEGNCSMSTHSGPRVVGDRAAILKNVLSS